MDASYFQCDVRNLNLDQNKTNPDCEELTRCLDRAIDTYMSYGNPESCCENLERILSRSFQDEELQAEELPRRKFMLHPLHYLSLNAYIVLASTYRVRSNHSLSIRLSEDNKSKARASVAYSLLLVGAANHLLLSDSSLIASVSLFCTSTGEAILGLARSLARNSTDSTIETGFCLISDHSQWTIREGSSVSWDEFRAASMGFLECLPCILLNTWPFLVRGFPYLESIRSPINFNWLGTAIILHPVDCVLPIMPSNFVPSAATLREEVLKWIPKALFSLEFIVYFMEDTCQLFVTVYSANELPGDLLLFEVLIQYCHTEVDDI